MTTKEVRRSGDTHYFVKKFESVRESNVGIPIVEGPQNMGKGAEPAGW